MEISSGRDSGDGLCGDGRRPSRDPCDARQYLARCCRNETSLSPTPGAVTLMAGLCPADGVLLCPCHRQAGLFPRSLDGDEIHLVRRLLVPAGPWRASLLVAPRGAPPYPGGCPLRVYPNHAAGSALEVLPSLLRRFAKGNYLRHGLRHPGPYGGPFRSSLMGGTP